MPASALQPSDSWAVFLKKDALKFLFFYRMSGVLDQEILQMAWKIIDIQSWWKFKPLGIACSGSVHMSLWKLVHQIIGCSDVSC